MIARYRRLVSSGGLLSMLAIASGVMIVVLILYPLANLVGGLFLVDGQISLGAVARTIAEPDLATVLTNTLIYVLASGFAALVIGAVLAWLSERTDGSLGWATNFIPLVPIFLPSIAGALGWVLLLAPRAGLVNIVLRAAAGSDAVSGPIDIFSLPGMIVVTAIHLVPYAYLAASAALGNLDASMEEASRTSGAGVLRTVARVSLPLVTPALISSAVLIFMSGVTLFSIPAVLGNTAHFTVLSTLIYNLLYWAAPPRMAEVIVLSVLSLSVIQVLVWVQLALGARKYQTIGAQGMRRARVRLGRLRVPARALIVLYFLMASVLPLLALVIVSFEKFWSPDISPTLLTLSNFVAIIDSSAQAVTALRNSLVLGVGAAVVDLTVATLLAYYLLRSPGFVARALDVIATLPATVPHIVMGVAFILAFTRPPLVLYGTVTLIFLAYLAVYMPQAMQFAKFSFGQISPDLGEASRVFGASEGRTFLRILVPLILPSAIAGGIVVAVHGLNELNASVMLASVDSVVVGPTLYLMWAEGKVPQVAAFATLICAVDIVLVLASIHVGRVLSAGRTS